MSDEQIKEIIIALIENKYAYGADSNKELGEEIAELFNAIKEETNKL